MSEPSWFLHVVEWCVGHLYSLIWTGVMLVIYLLVTKITLPMIEKKVDQSNFKSEEVIKAYHMIRLVAGILTLAVILIIWGVDFSGLLVLSTSLITLTGVALFASWSLLSNITCYFLILFHTSFRRGNLIRILDADNYVEGYISEVGLFNTKLLTEQREVIVYPNNLVLNRPTIVNPRDRWNTIGKTTDKSNVLPSAVQNIDNSVGPNTR
jgi:small-conductance mechanosensitive channel